MIKRVGLIALSSSLVACVGLSGAVASDYLVKEVAFQCTNDPKHDYHVQPFLGDVLEDDAREIVGNFCRSVYGGRAYNLNFKYK
jgi:hypothetical protein